MTATIHDFAESVAKSKRHADAPWWLEVYRHAFPRLQSAVYVNGDGWAQRAGIDRVLTLSCGRVIKIDEKVREKDWPDFALERWSDEARRVPGWLQKPLDCDFIAYAFLPSATCYLLPVLTLQRAWRLHGRTWLARYPEARARNRSYVTVSICVPRQVLLAALADAMTVTWQRAA